VVAAAEQARQHVQSISVALTLKAVNAELAKHGHKAQLGNGGGYFSFWGGEAQDWLDSTASVPKLSSPHAGPVAGGVPAVEQAQ
jgi:hypothetical protein